ncbi:SPOR domain-containing protein [Caenimonas aquaedulcis]|uniref:SPOR domain-containing protein n=1 Tax=Caenimonas aquaedulcis TaxID=2793270 RepID=A0A931H7D1_9BURK|nr:SPOR domain-containing protein [Caenimonas aquaedulcis]MBG9390036.1 SPOR domain-containing protein [Caenimonas aquaedulcis]
MAFFKFRKAGAEPASPPQPESIEAMRKRAKHRLIGAVVLVLIAVIGFPLLFDTQPRPIAVDIPIEIPDRNKVKPLPVPAPAAANASVGAPAVVAQAPVAAGPVTVPEPQPAKVEAAPAKVEPKPEAKAEAKAEPKVAKAEPKPEPKADDGAKAKALLEGKPLENVSSPTAAEGRYVVQVGAFADAAKAQETRKRVEKAGLKTYTHVAETKEGKRIRVRVGPFGTRAEADKAAERIKGLDLPAAVLTL